MANIISSAIVNKPPPQVSTFNSHALSIATYSLIKAIANLLARRNRLHHLDKNTDETLLKMFDKDPGHEVKTAASNHVTMPSRNWAMITENPTLSSTQIQSLDNSKVSSIANDNNELGTNERQLQPTGVDECSGRDGHSPLHFGEVDTGTKNRAVTCHGKSHDGSLDVCIRVEKDQKDKEGHTEVYGMWIPALKYDGAADKTLGKDAAAEVLHDALHDQRN
jgi:hypothetical protein